MVSCLLAYSNILSKYLKASKYEEFLIVLIINYIENGWKVGRPVAQEMDLFTCWKYNVSYLWLYFQHFYYQGHVMKRNKKPRLINTYSGLAKLYSDDDELKLKKFQEFARTTHLYDPQFFFGRVKDKKINFFTAMFGNKKGKIIIDIKRLMNCTEALIYSLHLIQYQVHNAKDIETGERLVLKDSCLVPDFDLVYEFIQDHLTKWINHDYLEGNKKVFELLESGDYEAKCVEYHNKAMKEIPLIWCKGSECKELFAKLGFGNKGYIYGQMKEYKTKPLTKNEQTIMRLFMKRGEEDLKMFTKDVEEKGLTTAFREWYKGKKFIESNIAFIMINRVIGLRSKAFKRFAAKLEGVHFDRVVNAYAKDKRLRMRSNNSGTKVLSFKERKACRNPFNSNTLEH